LVAEAVGAPAEFWKHGKTHPEIASVGTMDRQSEFCVYKSHHVRADLAALNDQMVYIVRDVRDVIVSAAAFFPDLGGMSMLEISEALRGGIHAKLDLVSWNAHVAGYLDARVYWVRYEDLLDDAVPVLAGVLRHFGIERSATQIEVVTEAHTFAAIKARLMSAPEEPWRQEALSHLRVGTAGQFRQWGEHDITKVTKWFMPTLVRLGYVL